MSRILPTLLLFFLIVSCSSEGDLVGPDLTAARSQADTDLTSKTAKLSIVDYLHQDTTTLPTDLSGLASIGSKENLFIGFSQLLNGNTVTPRNDDNKITQNKAAIQVWVCDSKAENCVLKPDTEWTMSYRPEGGYIPPTDTPISHFPPPAIMLEFSSALTGSSIVRIDVIAGKISNSRGVFMEQIKNSKGEGITTPDGSQSAGTVLFKTE